MHTNDIHLTNEDIGQLENVGQLIHFFARLGYNVDDAISLDHALLGLDSEDLRQQIQAIHRLASDPDDDIVIYFFQVRSVTIALRQTIARRFRERTEDALLVLTKEFDSLDFVLIDKGLAKGQTLGKVYKQIIRPRSLTVNRRNPDRVARRVLQRFTLTETHSDHQWDKLKAAYDVAEWAEPEFNNRALFSDYYLKNRLTDTQITPVWAEDVRPIGRQIMQHFSGVRQTYTGQPERTMRHNFYEPIFQTLGFEFEIQKSGTSSAEEADYRLYTPGQREKPVAMALTYVWNRNLDMDDPKRDPDTGDEIPGALIVSVLENSDVPWVIMTNGKLWRLYSATTSNKATNYYEIDLEEALAAPDQLTSLKYWWLFFRQAAFTGFLDELLQQSADYAQALGNRLKERVFTQIFPHFAAGFIHYANVAATSLSRPQRGKDAAPTMDVVYQGTLTFLYRLMFVLYAESLELLPLYEERGYRELSLYKMKQEIAQRADTILDEAPDKLKKHYFSNSTELYDRLAALFTVIDEGSADLNLPTYNGGLFSRTNENGEFLAHYKIPDRHLVLGLDRLCRDVDDKTQALVFIDYKSLGVRHLGSIYEGLLEFKLHIAQEELAVVKNQIVAATSLSRTGRGKDAAATRGRGKGRVQATIGKGEVYLENDKKERKATGSYYTPDYIVKYIVENTVGPVLARKFDELRPRLREAQKQYHQHKQKVIARGNDQPPELFWDGQAMRQLANDCLNVRVLDPAMGSGHFLVEVVDVVSNRLIDFLNGWTDNPVWGLLNRTRDDIVQDMERQRVTIDVDKLTRVALLKRAVLKRCVYGVDLNLMAVELAKVSLWLDAFTLGAPLSFLDHHLKQGNSLIGARIEEARAAIEGTAETAVQLSLFSKSHFTGMKMAVDAMRQVSFLSDNTVAQVQESQTAYRSALDFLDPFKRVLDVYTSRWFGNTPRQSKKDTFDPAVQLLQLDEAETWLQNPQTSLPTTGGTDWQQIADTALDAAEEKRFFHWELEFPEVYFAPENAGGQDVQLLKNGGFDVVVGNPPYISVTQIDDLERPYYLEKFSTAVGRFDVYIVFTEQSLRILSINGMMSFIMPVKFCIYANGKPLRQMILSENQLLKLLDISQCQDVFLEPSTYPCIPIIRKTPPNDDAVLKVAKAHEKSAQEFLATINNTLDEQTDGISIKELLKTPDFIISPSINTTIWQLLRQILANSHSVEDFFGIEQAIRIGSAKVRKELVVQELSELKDRALAKPMLDGTHLGRYRVQWGGDYLIYKPKQLYNPKTTELLDQKKIMIKRVANELSAALDNGKHSGGYFYPLNTVYVLKPKRERDLDERYALSLLNSSLLDWIYRIQYEAISVRGGYIEFRENIKYLPLPKLGNRPPEKNRLLEEVEQLYSSKSYEQLLDLLVEQCEHNKYLVHDALTIFSQYMMDLNELLQQESQKFLSQLERTLRIRTKTSVSGIDSLNGKSIIQNYLGDYQKGELELPWDDFYYRLHQNRNRCGVNLAQVKAQIQQEYENSLALLLPIKQQLAATDALIDQIVYKLYGLTDDEIELIERPAYEQALSEAKAKALQDKKLQKDPEATRAAIADSILPAAKRLQSRVNISTEEAQLNQDIPGWHLFQGDVPTFLLTGEYNIGHLPDHLDFSTSVIGYTKAVEQALVQRIFEPFRAAGFGPDDTKNKILQGFLVGTRKLTLGNFAFFFTSSEKALRRFVEQQYPGRGQTLFFEQTAGVRALLNDQTSIDLRNKAAHSEVLSKDDAKNGRQWALSILRYL